MRANAGFLRPLEQGSAQLLTCLLFWNHRAQPQQQEEDGPHGSRLSTSRSASAIDQGPASIATHLRGLASCRHTEEEPGDTWSLAKGWHRGHAGQVVQLLSLPRQRSLFTSMTPSSGKNLKCPSGRGAMDFRECLTFPFYGQGHRGLGKQGVIWVHTAYYGELR